MSTAGREEWGSPEFETRGTRLENGLTVLIRRVPTSDVAAVVTRVGAGYFDESDAEVGISHVLEHMYFKGTSRRGPGDIGREIRSAGGHINAGTSYDRPERLLLAYGNGIFPWFSKGEPIMWWSPEPRCVLHPDRLKISTSLRQALKRGGYEVPFDTCFGEVIKHCSATKLKGQRGTWITNEMVEAYLRLHELGYAHSTEVFMDGKLAGGLYGVSVGKTYSGESMFLLRPEASKIALFHLVQRLKEWTFPLIDCQVTNPHLLSLGAEEMPRKEFLRHN